MELTRDELEFGHVEVPRHDATAHARDLAPVARRASRRRASIRSEWTKLRSLRSTRWSLLVATSCSTIGFPILAATVISSHWGRVSPREHARLQPARPGARRRRRSPSSRSACSACS